jgi:hypothetical protein
VGAACRLSHHGACETFNWVVLQCASWQSAGLLGLGPLDDPFLELGRDSSYSSASEALFLWAASLLCCWALLVRSAHLKSPV